MMKISWLLSLVCLVGWNVIAAHGFVSTIKSIVSPITFVYSSSLNLNVEVSVTAPNIIGSVALYLWPTDGGKLVGYGEEDLGPSGSTTVNVTIAVDILTPLSLGLYTFEIVVQFAYNPWIDDFGTSDLQTLGLPYQILCVSNANQAMYLKSPTTGLVADLQSGAVAGSNVVMNTIDPVNFVNQLWVLTSMSNGQIQSANPTLSNPLVMDIYGGGGGGPGTSVIVWNPDTADPASNELWTYSTISSNLVSSLPDVDWALDVAGASTAPGTQVIVWYEKSAGQNDNQMFQWVTPPTAS